MIIEYEGERYPFDFDDISVKQAMVIEKHTGMPFAEWGEALEKGGNLLCLQAMGWLILEHGDLGRPVADCDFKMTRLGAAFAAAVKSDADAAAAADPTMAAPGAGPAGAAEPNGRAPGGPLSAVPSALT